MEPQSTLQGSLENQVSNKDCQNDLAKGSDFVGKTTKDTERDETGDDQTERPLSADRGIVQRFTALFKREKQWACQSCTCLNGDEHASCGACGNSRPTGRFRSLLKLPTALAQAWRRRSAHFNSEEDSMQWICSRCASRNNPYLEYCECCRAPLERRIGPEEQLPSAMEDRGNQDILPAVPKPRIYPPAPNHHITSAYNDLSLGDPCDRDTTHPHSALTIDNLGIEGQTQFYTGSFASVKSMSVQQRKNHDENEARDQIRHIVLMCKQTSSRFVDPDFQPDHSSLAPAGKVAGSRMWQVEKWLRPDQIKDFEHNPAPWKVFRTPRPADIHQGALGNCWFLSALAVMAEQPELIEQILVTREYLGEGVYQIRLCKNGRWIIVTIDDLLPCNASNTLVFSQARRKQLWVPLIEKAIAKLFGSYEALHSGTIQEGLSLLTGVACEELDVGSYGDAIDGEEVGDTDCELLWASLLSFRDAGFLVAAACGTKEGVGDDQEQLYRNKGLTSNHAYSVLDVKMISLSAGKPLRLLRLRNPWGRFSWNGLWSDASPVWRDFPSLRNELMPCGAEEGIFWMQWDDFVRYFYRIVVCKYRPHWYCESIHGSLLPPGQLKVMSLEVVQSTQVDICLYQTSTRGREEDQLSWNLFVLVVKCDSPEPLSSASDLTFTTPRSVVFQSSCTSQDSVSCSGWLDEGWYAVIPLSFLSWESAIAPAVQTATGHINGSGSSRDYILSVFSHKPVLLDKVGLLPGFTSRAIYLLAKKIGKRGEFTKFAPLYHISLPRICRMAVVENRCNAHITVTTDASESYNMSSTRGSLVTTDVIPPDHWQILWVFSRPVESLAYSLSMKLEYRLTPNNPEGKWGAMHVPPYPDHLQEFHQVYPLA